MNLQINTLLQGGKYKIEKILGQGGFGITYLATQELLDRKVCIKEFFFKDSCGRTSTGTVTLGMVGNKDLAQRFLNKFIKEARTISKLEHPNIIRILDIFMENGTAYYVMDFIEGESLEDIVKRRGALPEHEAIGYIKQVANALDYLHQHRINHLDVKPANIMIRRNDNKAILIDFGVSKQYDSQGEQTSTTPVGISYGYAPIEQYRPGGVREFSPQADIYALGATLYKLVTGKLPPQAIEIFNEGLSGLPNSLSSDLSNAIRKAMELKKSDRPQNIKEFMNTLNASKTNQKVSSFTASKSSINETTQLIKQVQPKKEINGHEYVDLGLPSGLKWATCNVGANKPEEYGDYFAWGEVMSKKKYGLLNYKVSLGIRMKEISGSQHDAARYNWGGSWRLPTKSEFQELLDKCTCSRTNQNGKEGYKITGPNGNHVFFPAAGHRDGNLLTLEGECGHYLSSSPKNTLNAYILGFRLSMAYRGVNGACREMGYSVRPVSV